MEDRVRDWFLFLLTALLGLGFKVWGLGLRDHLLSSSTGEKRVWTLLAESLRLLASRLGFKVALRYSEPKNHQRKTQ